MATHGPASNAIGVGLIGAGFIADFHLAGLKAAGGGAPRRIAARATPASRVRAAALAQRHAIPEVDTDWRRMLEDRDVDAVIIVTPDHTHEEIAVAAAAAGKSILLQKPMAGSVDACRRILDAAARAGVDLQVSFMHRHFEEVDATRAALEAGRIGTIHTARLRNATPGPGWGDWFFDAANVGSGVVDQLGVHGIDLALQLLGPVRDVSARMETRQPRRRLDDGRLVEVGVPDNALATYGHVAGALLTHEMSMTEQGGCDRFRLELYGEHGTIWLRSELGRLAIREPRRHGDRWVLPTLEEAPAGARLHARWLAGLVGRAPRENTAQDAIRGMQVVEAIRTSASRDSGRVLVAPDEKGRLA
ncbi:MAG: Gfo/Idh/MocA family protein [Lautropia sp.]